MTPSDRKMSFMLSGRAAPTRSSSTPLTQPRLGVDIGRVIIDGDGPDSAFLGVPDAVAMHARAVAGSFDALARLRERFEGRVWLISKCGKGVEARTRAWLAHHEFWARTGIDAGQVTFCRSRGDKGPICERLGITCFVDDRTDIIESMAGIVRTRLLFGATVTALSGVVAVPTWAAAEVAILESLTALRDGGG